MTDPESVRGPEPLTMAGAIRAFEHAGWERAAQSYPAAFATATRQFIPDLLDAARVEAGCRVLDIACGPGFVAAAAATWGAAARGLDFSAAMLSVARSLHPHISFDQGDAEALPYPDGGFDAAVSNFGIHHVPHPVAALREAYRVLRPGGRMAFTVWAGPDENIAWKLVFDAVRRYGDLSASRAPAPGGGLGSQAACLAGLREAGFADVAGTRVDATWRHADGMGLLTALRSGTARMAALIDAQSPEVLPAIAAEIDRAATGYRDTEGLAIPITAFVAFGRRDQSAIT